jgi:hypothetical protein
MAGRGGDGGTWNEEDMAGRGEDGGTRGGLVSYEMALWLRLRCCISRQFSKVLYLLVL